MLPDIGSKIYTKLSTENTLLVYVYENGEQCQGYINIFLDFKNLKPKILDN
jgi:hypothetical protein